MIIKVKFILKISLYNTSYIRLIISLLASLILDK